MKTIDEVIKRNDYKKLVPQLKEKSIEIAQLILHKMIELDCEDVCFKVDAYIRCHKYSGNGGTETHLVVEGDYGQIYSLNVWKGYYLNGDFSNVFIEPADNKMRLVFLNSVQDILQRLTHIEDTLTAQVESTLRKAESIAGNNHE